MSDSQPSTTTPARRRIRTADKYIIVPVTPSQGGWQCSAPSAILKPSNQTQGVYDDFMSASKAARALAEAKPGTSFLIMRPGPVASVTQKTVTDFKLND